VTILIAFAAAVLIASAIVFAIAVISRISAARNFRVMASAKCPRCTNPIGLAAVKNGRECSPFEELWTDDDEVTVHCHPQIRRVECVHCHECVEIRLNKEGPRFGPRLTAVGGETRLLEKGVHPEVVAEMKSWLARFRHRR
jgi:hypothetical protein